MDQLLYLIISNIKMERREVYHSFISNQ